MQYIYTFVARRCPRISDFLCSGVCNARDIARGTYPSGPLERPVPFFLSPPPFPVHRRCTPGIRASRADATASTRLLSIVLPFPSPSSRCHACPLFFTLSGASRARRHTYIHAHTRTHVHIHVHVYIEHVRMHAVHTACGAESKGECSAPAGVKPVSR